jgi:hypothetical protein
MNAPCHAGPTPSYRRVGPPRLHKRLKLAVTQAMLPLLREVPAGRIVNVSSGAGSLTSNANPANAHRRMYGVVYTASKTASTRSRSPWPLNSSRPPSKSTLRIQGSPRRISTTSRARRRSNRPRVNPSASPSSTRLVPQARSRARAARFRGELASSAPALWSVDQQTASYAKAFRGLLIFFKRKPRIAIKGIAKIRAHFQNVNQGPTVSEKADQSG